MVVDWFTVVAQILNFLVLVWLLKRFLYKPILNAIDAREIRIATQLADAADKKSLADEEHEIYRLKNEQFDAQRDALLSQATDQAAQERERLLVEALHAAEQIRQAHEEALKSEIQTLQKDIARRSRDEVFAITRNVLGALAGVTLEERMAELFVERLRALDAATLKNLKAAQEVGDSMMIQSGFELGAEQKTAMRAALFEGFERDTEVRFQVVPGVISGIELGLDGHKIAWSISEYLVEMEKNISEILGEEKPGFRAGKAHETV